MINTNRIQVFKFSTEIPEPTEEPINRRTKEGELRYREKMRKIALEKGYGKWMIGRKASEETKTKMRLNSGRTKPWLGKKQPPEMIKKRVEARRGYRPTKETLEKMSKALAGKYTREKHWSWLGLDKKYPVEWNNKLKKEIRERDNFTCWFCLRKEESRKHHVHHINYDKNNCLKDNLITLCSSCHQKTNYNRHFWQFHFDSVKLLCKIV